MENIILLGQYFALKLAAHAHYILCHLTIKSLLLLYLYFDHKADTLSATCSEINLQLKLPIKIVLDGDNEKEFVIL
ncbi:hypothetical protein HZS_3679 [Henneguya salminicola]|nr:hypothetical protein HZS_3679 [Henneguya salminicola]